MSNKHRPFRAMRRRQVCIDELISILYAKGILAPRYPVPDVLRPACDLKFRYVISWINSESWIPWPTDTNTCEEEYQFGM